MKRLLIIAALILSLSCLAACGEAPAVPTATPTPPPVTELTLSGESAEEILALAENTALERVDATASREYEALLALREALPDCEVEWNYTLCGREVSSRETELIFEAGDPVDAEELLEGLRYLPELSRVDLCALPMEEPDMARLTEACPDVFFVWMVSFADKTVRSDITCYSTLQGGYSSSRWTDADIAPLFRYCTELRALDLGHNDLRDISALARLTKLKVLIIVDNPSFTDASAIGTLKDLEYLEFFLNYGVRDYSFLNGLANMVDLNLSHAPLTDFAFLDGMPELKTAWLGNCPVSAEEAQRVRAEHPEADIRTDYGGTLSATGAGWRAFERNIAIRKAFKNWPAVLCFNGWDDVSYAPDAVLIETFADYERG